MVIHISCLALAALVLGTARSVERDDCPMLRIDHPTEGQIHTAGETIPVRVTSASGPCVALGIEGVDQDGTWASVLPPTRFCNNEFFYEALESGAMLETVTSEMAETGAAPVMNMTVMNIMIDMPAMAGEYLLTAATDGSSNKMAMCPQEFAVVMIELVPTASSMTHDRFARSDSNLA